MNAAEEKNKIIDENAIDILRDERMMINSTIRGEANMRWGVSAALLYITLIIYHFSLASHSVFILGASLICNSIISIAIIITNVYFERCGVINCYHLLKVDNDINRLMGREILYYNRKYARFGISPIGEIGNIKKWRFITIFLWLIILVHPIFSILHLWIRINLVYSLCISISFSIILSYIINHYFYSAGDKVRKKLLEEGIIKSI